MAISSLWRTPRGRIKLGAGLLLLGLFAGLFVSATRFEVLAIDRNSAVLTDPPAWLRAMTAQVPATEYHDPARILESAAFWPLALMQFFKSSEGWTAWTGDGSVYFNNDGEKILASEHILGRPFSDGLSSVGIFAELSGNTMPSGYIDTTGDIVLRGGHIGSFPFVDGLARFFQNNHFGYIDKTGAIVIPAIYDGAGEFSKGMAPVEWMDGNTCRVAYIDPAGEVVLELDSGRFSSPGTFHEDLATIEVVSVGPQRHYGFIDRSGELVIEAKYEAVKDFSEGLAAVATEIHRGEQWATMGTLGNWGYIDTRGKEVIPLHFSDAESFRNGVAPVFNVGWFPAGAAAAAALKMKLGRL